MRRKVMACAAAAALLSGCGGGGGSSSGSGGTAGGSPGDGTGSGTGGGGPTISLPVPMAAAVVQTQLPGDLGTAPTLIAPPSLDPPQTATPASFETPQYFADWGLNAIHASSAYAVGATGQGITVAVIDTGVSTGNPDLASALSPSSTDILGRQGNPIGEHGTWVASVLGAQQNGVGPEGVAFHSTILSVRADTAGTCTSSGGCNFLDSDLATATTYAVAHGARVLNYSMGGTDPLDPSFQTALQNAVAAQAILVFAAGNTNGGNVNNPASFAATAASQGQALAVGAVDQNNQIAAFSAHANGAAAYFLVAPGVNVAASGFGGTVATVNGTSFAAPLVAGAAAVVLSAAPYLTSQQVVSLLLNTATPLGDPTIYGHGLLNLQAALSPQGPLVIAAGTSVTGTTTTASATTLSLGAAFGNALANNGLMHAAMALDSYGRGYTLDLAPQVGRAPSVPQLDGMLAPDQLHESSVGSPDSRFYFHMDSFDTGTDAPPRLASAAGTFDLGEVGRLDLSQGTGLGQQMGLTTTLGPDQSFLSRDAFHSPYLNLAGQGTAVMLGHDLGNGQWIRMGYAGRSMGMGATDPNAPAALQSQITDPQDQTLNDPSAPRRQAFAGEYGITLSNGLSLAAQGGSLREQGSILDTGGQGGFDTGAGQAVTRFGGLSGSLPLSADTALFANYSRGWTDATAPAQSLLSNFQGLSSQSMGAGVTTRHVWRDSDRLTFSLSQPLRVSQGTALLNLPVGRTMDGQVVRDQEQVGLTPTGREIDAEMDYGLWLGNHQDLMATLLTEASPGHDASAGPAAVVGIRYRVSW